MEKKIELTRGQLTKILHSATGNVKDFVMNEQEWINEQLSIHGVVGQSEQLVCDVCGSNDVIEAPHMGRNCNQCNPL